MYVFVLSNNTSFWGLKHCFITRENDNHGRKENNDNYYFLLGSALEAFLHNKAVINIVYFFLSRRLEVFGRKLKEPAREKETR